MPERSVPVRAAVVGAGQIGRHHLECLSRLEGAAIVGVCDRSAVTAQAAAARFGGVAWFTDHKALLEEVRPQVVHVATGVASHAAIARAALATGAHVVVEKPAAPDHARLAALVEHAERSRRLLVEDHSYVFAPDVQRLLRMQREGELGEVVHVDADLALDVLGPESRFVADGYPHPSACLPGGPLADLLPHLASLACAFLGPHEEVRVLRRRRGEDHHLPWDELRALVAARHGTATLSFSAHAQPDVCRLRVEGTRLRAEANLFDAGLRVSRRRRGYRPLQPVLNGFSEARAAAIGPLRAMALKVAGTPPALAGLDALVRRTYAAVTRSAAPPVTPAHALAVQRLVDDLVGTAG